MSHQERVNIAVFIDFDNIEIGVRTTLSEHFDVGVILEALKERGEVVTKIAYADWTRAGEYSRHLTQHAIRLVQRNLTPGGDKNGADINLALDALEMVFTHTHINAFVIVGGDSDFLSLVEKLKQYNKKVFVVGGRQFTSVILQRNCHEFIAYENLMRKPQRGSGERQAAPAAAQPITQAFALVRRAIKILSDREVSPQTGLLKSTLLQLDSTFSERTYGASTFLDFVEKLGQAGLVQLKHSGRSVMVELNPTFKDDDAGKPRPVETPAASSSVEATVVEAAADAGAPAPSTEPVTRLGDNAEGVRIAGQLMAAATTARWPMYLRNAKQILRAGNFDERKYGFGGLIDLLKACQREGLLRIERDRRGGLRVFQGQSLRASLGGNIGNVEAPSSSPSPAIFDIANELDPETGELREDLQPFRAEPVPVIPIDIDADLDADVEQPDTTAVVDTTAELLGRAKARKPRSRASALSSNDDDAAAPRSRASGARKSGAKKSAAPPARRSRKKAE